VPIRRGANVERAPPRTPMRRADLPSGDETARRIGCRRVPLMMEHARSPLGRIATGWETPLPSAA
jgi:hypothetical protein